MENTDRRYAGQCESIGSSGGQPDQLSPKPAGLLPGAGSRVRRERTWHYRKLKSRKAAYYCSKMISTRFECKVPVNSGENGVPSGR